MNKKGDIPVTILVIGVIAVCALALFSFYYSSVSVRNSFMGIDIIENLNSFAEEIKFNQEMQFGDPATIIDDLNKKYSDSKKNFNIGESNGNIYVEARYSEKKEETFSAKYYLD